MITLVRSRVCFALQSINYRRSLSTRTRKKGSSRGADPRVYYNPRQLSHLKESAMTRLLASFVLLAVGVVFVHAQTPAAPQKVTTGEQAPAFTIKDASGKIITLADLTAKGPVLVRLT